MERLVVERFENDEDKYLCWAEANPLGYTVNGAVMRPDVYYMDVSARLRDAVARAGGISEVGKRKKVFVIRDGVQHNVSNWETDTSDASMLLSGDQVLIGRRNWLDLNIIPVVSLGLATASFVLSLRNR